MMPAPIAEMNRRETLFGLGCGVLSPFALQSLADQPSPWSRALHSGIRLLPGGPVDDSGTLAAILQINLDKGFKTYWRTPGDSGIPPSFSFEGSENAADIAVHFPAPVRFEDGAGGHSIGYRGPLVELPITLRQLDRLRPVQLALRMDYAVCEKICVPSAGQTALIIQPQKALHAQMLRMIAEELPRKQALAAAGELSILALEKSATAEHFSVLARLPAHSDADLFVEGGTPWLFDSRGFVRRENGLCQFTVMAIDRDRTPDCRGAEITLTLSSGNHAIETRTWLDVKLLQA